MDQVSPNRRIVFYYVVGGGTLFRTLMCIGSDETIKDINEYKMYIILVEIAPIL